MFMPHSECYNAFNVYRRELAPGTVSLTGDRAQGDDSKHWANNNSIMCKVAITTVVPTKSDRDDMFVYNC